MVNRDPVDPAALIARLAESGLTIAVAESLTGGLLAARLIDVPGASAVVRGAIVAYAPDLKLSLLGVGDSILAGRGAVDPEVALQMAQGVRSRLLAQIGVATTGVAGPATEDGKPVGTVYIAAVGPSGPVVSSHEFVGDRASIRRQSVEQALVMIDELTIDRGLPE